VGERQIWLVRHGETEWARDGRHTGLTDIPLTDAGREQARAIGERLIGHRFALVLTSPLSRARETATLADYADAIVEPDLHEWDYGAFEGRTTLDIRAERPDWTIWGGPWEGGESAEDVGARADRVIARCLDPGVDGGVLLFAHGHLLRVLSARWIELPPSAGARLALGTATLSVLGWDRETRCIEIWNDSGHLP
jgi:probable phosphoglycerate mutase